MPPDSYSVNVYSELKLLRNIIIFNHLSQVFLFKTGIADICTAFMPQARCQQNQRANRLHNWVILWRVYKSADSLS